MYIRKKERKSRQNKKKRGKTDSKKWSYGTVPNIAWPWILSRKLNLLSRSFSSFVKKSINFKKFGLIFFEMVLPEVRFRSFCKIFQGVDALITKAIPIKCFVSYRPVFCDGGSVGGDKKKKMNTWGVWVLEKVGLLSKEAWLQSQLDNVVFSTIKCLNSL